MFRGYSTRRAAMKYPAWGTTDFPRIVARARGSSMKTDPVELINQEIERIFVERL
jgi:hypothetical protein